MATSSPEEKNVTLLDLLDRILDRGVVLTGDLTISVADVDLIVVGLRVLLASVDRLEQAERVGMGPSPLLPGRELLHG